MEQLKKDMERISGEWSGEEPGIKEERAGIATEILAHLESIKVLQEALEELK